MSTIRFPRHPDTIASLDPDCRRVLCDAYAVIQARAGHTHPDVGAVRSAIAEYRRIARQWGIES